MHTVGDDSVTKLFGETLISVCKRIRSDRNKARRWEGGARRGCETPKGKNVVFSGNIANRSRDKSLCTWDEVCNVIFVNEMLIHITEEGEW
jgi:hypothetical protein